MNSKKIAYTLMTLSFIMIISGGVSSFIGGLQADRMETQKRIAVVNNEFEALSTNTTVFEGLRDELYTKVLSDVYYDTMNKDDEKVKEKLSNYENLVDELEKTTFTLDSLCGNVYYPDMETNTKCSNYRSIYEQVNNYFISDIEVYNKNVEKYNKYQESKKSKLAVDPYATRRDYIDYNGDKKYDGKEEV